MGEHSTSSGDDIEVIVVQVLDVRTPPMGER